MSDKLFGEELANARKLNGYSIQQVSDALRIRPDILRAIELDDFARMPAKGFVRNQVSAYARFLGLDSSEVTQKFMRAYSDFERHAVSSYGYVTNFQQPTGDRGYSTARRVHQEMDDEAARHGARNHDRTSPRQSARSQTYSQSRSGQTKALPHKSGKPQASQTDWELQEGNFYDDDIVPADPRERERRHRLQMETRGQSKSVNSSNRARRRPVGKKRSSDKRGGASVGSTGFNPSGKTSARPRILLIAAVVVVLLLVVLGVSRCVSSTNAVSQNPSLEEGGALQVTGGSENTQASLPNVSVADVTATPDIKYSSATSFDLVVTLRDKASCFMQIDVDGTSQVSGQTSGPQEYKYTVTSTASLRVGNPSAVKVTTNGREQALNVDELGVGTLNLALVQGRVVTGEEAVSAAAAAAANGTNAASTSGTTTASGSTSSSANTQN